MRCLLYLLLLMPSIAFSQVNISGRVIDSNKTPVANANVFLSNATIGKRTADDGTFMLTNVKPGQYTVVVSSIGYETHSQNILVNAGDMRLGDITIKSKVTQLQEVKINPGQWDRDYAIFKHLFLGSSDDAQQCEIINPDVLDFDNDRTAKIFSASSNDFLIIVNHALGYNVKYLLSKLTMDYNQGELFYEGSVLFEDLGGTPSQQKRWKKKRLEAYQGSTMHFLRSVRQTQLDENNFVVYNLIRKPNPKWTSGIHDKWLQTLVKTPLQANQIAGLTDKKGIYALSDTVCLYVMYTKKRDNSYNAVSSSLNMPGYLSSIITFAEAYTFFDDNGVILNPGSCIFEGSWGKSTVADLLPVDYDPTQ